MQGRSFKTNEVRLNPSMQVPAWEATFELATSQQYYFILDNNRILITIVVALNSSSVSGLTERDTRLKVQVEFVSLANPASYVPPQFAINLNERLCSQS